MLSSLSTTRARDRLAVIFFRMFPSISVKQNRWIIKSPVKRRPNRSIFLSCRKQELHGRRYHRSLWTLRRASPAPAPVPQSKERSECLSLLKETRRLLQKHCCGYMNVIHRQSQTLFFSAPSHYLPAPCAPTGSRPAVECGYSCSAMAAESPQCPALKERTHTTPILSERKSGV